MSEEDHHLGGERRGRDRDSGRDRSYSRSRSRSNDHARDHYEQHEHLLQQGGNEEQGENFSLYITNLGFKITNDQLKAIFEKHVGPVSEATIVAEPHTRVSRGFGFVIMAKVEDSERALQIMDGHEVDGRPMKVEKARRKIGYDKTPGKYLGPPQLSTKYNPKKLEERDRDRERFSEYDYRDRDRYMRGVPPGYERYRDDYRDRYRDDYRRDPHYDPRGPPMMYPPYDRRSRSPPRAEYHRSRSPPLSDRRLPPPPYDRHGPPYSRGSMRY